LIVDGLAWSPVDRSISALSGNKYPSDVNPAEFVALARSSSSRMLVCDIMKLAVCAFMSRLGMLDI
jgi:hypothetical protein